MIDIGIVNRDFKFSYYDRKDEWNPWVFRKWRLVAFTYGTSIHDWRFWGSETTDIYAGEFWHMMEHPWESMPGAWNE